MPTYDANRANRLIGEMDKVYLSPATTITVSLGIDLAYQLLAATQEVERLRKLVGEACDLAMYLDSYVPKFPATGGPTMTQKRLAAIRHAAGVGEEG